MNPKQDQHLEKDITNLTHANTLSVTIKKPEKVEFTGKAKAITSQNNRGLFDVLPFHSNFISLIKNQVTLHNETGEAVTYTLEDGIIKVSNNEVMILIGIKTHD